MTQKPKKVNKRMLILMIWLALIALILALIFIIGLPSGEKSETIKEVMKDGVLHESNKIALFGLEVNPALISAYVVTGMLLIGALLIRIIVIPKFKNVPGKFQSLLEKAVGFFKDTMEQNGKHSKGFLGAYIFSAGAYILCSTLFELIGLQVVTTEGLSVALPAPLADINGAISMGVTSFLVILGAGIATNGFGGAFKVLKDFSLPISMSFRLFGALLSGLLVTELVYYYVPLSFGVPVIVGVLFTLLHAVIQAYVLITLVSIFYGEAVEPKKKKIKKVD